ncbi:MAG: imidazole glycerol phosphate synthase subunit HisH [Armatimonadota bacterium]|nr:imidazole glycerol phosphate synthase subunit HisH [bacterium]
MIAIVDYKAGNLTSVRLALEHIGASCEITDNPARIVSAERVIFPGVGAAAEAMRNLREMSLLDTLREVVSKGTPFLGICLGTQVIFEFSEEDGGTDCIGLIPGTCRKFTPSDPMCKIPQMGWNTVEQTRPHPLFEGIEDASEFYFVHSYYPAPSDSSYIVGETDYADVKFASAVGKGNLFATQFHPERSGRIGLKLLENFSKWDGRC